MNYKQAKKILDKHKDKAKYILIPITKNAVVNVCLENSLERLTKKQTRQILDVIDYDIQRIGEPDYYSLVDDLMSNIYRFILEAIQSQRKTKFF